MNYVAQIKECRINKTNMILDVLKNMFIYHFPWLKYNFNSDRIFSQRKLPLNFDIIFPTLFKHLHLSTSFFSASSIICTCSELLLARNYCHGELAFNLQWNWLSQLLKHKPEGRFQQFPTHVCWGLWLRLLRLLFLAYVSTPKEVTDIWKQVHYLLLPHSLKFTNFNYNSFACVRLDV